MTDLRHRLKIDPKRLDELNALLLDPKNDLVNRLLDVVKRHGGPEAINEKAARGARASEPLPAAPGDPLALPRGPRVAHARAGPRRVRLGRRLPEERRREEGRLDAVR